MYTIYLMEIQREINYLLNKRLKEYGLGKHDLNVLRVINANNGVNQNTICSILNEDKITVSKAVKKLSEVGYIEKRKGADDKRVTQIFMTEKGRANRNEIIRIFDEINNTLVKNLNDQERKIFESLLKKVAKGTNDVSLRLENE